MFTVVITKRLTTEEKGGFRVGYATFVQLHTSNNMLTETANEYKLTIYIDYEEAFKIIAYNETAELYIVMQWRSFDYI